MLNGRRAHSGVGRSALDVERWAFAKLWTSAIFPLPMSILIAILLGLWLLVALLMMLVILMQRPKSEGLGAAFGGAVTENLFGAQTTNVLVKFTAWLAGIFFLITFVLSVLYAHRSMGGSSLSRELKKTAPAAPAAQLSPAAAKPATSVAPGNSPAAATSPAGSAPPVTSKATAVPAQSAAITASVAAQAGSPVGAASASPKP